VVGGLPAVGERRRPYGFHDDADEEFDDDDGDLARVVRARELAGILVVSCSRVQPSREKKRTNGRMNM